MLEPIIQEDDIPVYVGTLTRNQALKGFHPTVDNHPVFELKDRYIIYMKSIDPVREQVFENGGWVTKTYVYDIKVPYYKKTLAPFIKFDSEKE